MLFLGFHHTINSLPSSRYNHSHCADALPFTLIEGDRSLPIEGLDGLYCGGSQAVRANRAERLDPSESRIRMGTRPVRWIPSSGSGVVSML